MFHNKRKWSKLFSDVEPKPNRNHKPTANGCGALGMKINSEYLPVNAMTKCCDQHDICYDICGNDKETCDVEFRKCLYKYCESYEKYLGGGTMMKGNSLLCYETLCPEVCGSETCGEILSKESNIWNLPLCNVSLQFSCHDCANNFLYSIHFFSNFINFLLTKNRSSTLMTVLK